MNCLRNPLIFQHPNMRQIDECCVKAADAGSLKKLTIHSLFMFYLFSKHTNKNKKAHNAAI